MTTDQVLLLWNELKRVFVAVDNLKAWLRTYYPWALQKLTEKGLEVELTNLLQESNAEDGRQALLQALCDHPPDPALPPMIYAFTLGAIKQRTVQYGQLPPHQRSFVASRPFVNRTNLRQQLQELANSKGGKRILVIDGDSRTGKSFAMNMALETEEADRVQWLVDVDNYARFALELDARKFAVEIVGHEKDCPSFDITKEEEAVPRLMTWLARELQDKKIWIIIDHCNRQVMTRGARNLLKLLVDALYRGGLRGVRLILADFNRAELSPQLQSTIRYDRAELPARQHVEEWCRQVATLENRAFDPGEPEQWTDDVFADLNTYKHEDGSWHVAFEQKLMHAVDVIKAHKELT